MLTLSHACMPVGSSFMLGQTCDCKSRMLSRKYHWLEIVQVVLLLSTYTACYLRSGPPHFVEAEQYRAGDNNGGSLYCTCSLCYFSRGCILFLLRWQFISPADRALVGTSIIVSCMVAERVADIAVSNHEPWQEWQNRSAT